VASITRPILVDDWSDLKGHTLEVSRALAEVRSQVKNGLSVQCHGMEVGPAGVQVAEERASQWIEERSKRLKHQVGSFGEYNHRLPGGYLPNRDRILEAEVLASPRLYKVCMMLVSFSATGRSSLLLELLLLLSQKTC
jgi:hypothetical protein